MTFPDDAKQEPTPAWLVQLGFTLGNPFVAVHAEAERHIMARLFVPPAIDETLLYVDRPLLIFATRGGGKSAIRVYLAMTSAPIEPHPTRSILSVEISSISELLQKYHPDTGVPLDVHIGMLLRAGVRTLLAYGCGLTHLHTTSRTPLAAHAAHTPPPLTGGTRLLLARYLKHYWADWNDATELEKIWQQFDPTFSVDADRLTDAVAARQVRTWLATTPLAHHPSACWLADLCDSAAPPLTDAEPEVQLGKFVELARRMGITKVQFLIDGLDESEETADNPALQVAMMQALLSSLAIMESPDVWFRIFFQDNVQGILEQNPKVRRDRLRLAPIVVQWTHDALEEMLRQRLIHFSEGKVQDFYQLVDEAVVGGKQNLNLNEWLWAKLMHHAGQAPRQLLTALRVLADTHQARHPRATRLVEADWDSALATIEDKLLSARQYPPLYINLGAGQVQLNGRVIRLTKLPFRVLEALVERAEQNRSCTIDRLIEMAWPGDDPGGVFESAVTKQIQRLRSKIGDVKPFRYIENTPLPEKGYRLRHYKLLT